MLPLVLRLSDSLLTAAICAGIVSMAAELTAAIQRQIRTDDVNQVGSVFAADDWMMQDNSGMIRGHSNLIHGTMLPAGCFLNDCPLGR